MIREDNENVYIILMNISMNTHLFFIGSPIRIKLIFHILFCALLYYLYILLPPFYDKKSVLFATRNSIPMWMIKSMYSLEFILWFNGIKWQHINTDFWRSLPYTHFLRQHIYNSLKYCTKWHQNGSEYQEFCTYVEK